jgi:hypothetical protein
MGRPSTTHGAPARRTDARGRINTCASPRVIDDDAASMSLRIFRRRAISVLRDWKQSATFFLA